MTNPTERPEEREGAVPDQAVSGDESVAALDSDAGAALSPTERPEERDSLDVIEARLASLYERSEPDDDTLLFSANADLRTLINEVKELREARNGWERKWVEDTHADRVRLAQMEKALREADSDVSWCLARHDNGKNKDRVRNTLILIRKALR